MKQQLLTHAQIEQKVLRIAYQVYEHNFDESELYLIGIQDSGYRFAELLWAELAAIAPFRLHLWSLQLDKVQPTQSRVELSDAVEQLAQKSVLLIDDVLNTGRTLAYSFKPFLGVPIKRLQTAVLVNREHHLFPVSADFSGYELATTLQEHIHVELKGEEYGVFLT